LELNIYEPFEISMKKQVFFQEKKISYEISGDGPVLLLLHGFLESKMIWNEFAEELQTDFTVISIDLPGHGETEMIAGIHSMKLMSEVVKTVLFSEGVMKAVVIGHSMGGYVALQFAVDNEEMILGLVLFHSHASADSDEARENRQRTINIVRQNHGGFIMQFIPDLFDPQHVSEYSREIEKLQKQASLLAPEAIIAALSGMRDRPNQLQYLSLSPNPVLFIIGKQDSRIPYSQVIAQAAIPSHAEMLLLGDVGHMGFIEAPVKTLQALKHFSIRCFEV